MVGSWQSKDKRRAKSLDPRGCIGRFFMSDTWWTGVTYVFSHRRLQDWAGRACGLEETRALRPPLVLQRKLLDTVERELNWRYGSANCAERGRGSWNGQ
eukprot:3939598-Amphidinium_carterae.1